MPFKQPTTIIFLSYFNFSTQGGYIAHIIFRR